jgi:hypothetical protein
LSKITNLIEFIRLFKIRQKQPTLRESPESVVVTMYPRLRYNPDNIEKYKEYCFHQLIRYSPWADENYEEIKTLHTAVDRWNNFLKTASSILASI